MAKITEIEIQYHKYPKMTRVYVNGAIVSKARQAWLERLKSVEPDHTVTYNPNTIDEYTELSFRVEE